MTDAGEERRRLIEWVALCSPLRPGYSIESARKARRLFERQKHWSCEELQAPTSTESPTLLPRRPKSTVWRRFVENRASGKPMGTLDYRAVVERLPYLYAVQIVPTRKLVRVGELAVRRYERAMHLYGYGGDSLHAGIAQFAVGMMCMRECRWNEAVGSGRAASRFWSGGSRIFLPLLLSSSCALHARTRARTHTRVCVCVCARIFVCLLQIGWLRAANASSRKYRAHARVTGETFAALAACQMARREYRSAGATLRAGVGWYARNAPGTDEDADENVDGCSAAVACSAALLALLGRAAAIAIAATRPRLPAGTPKSRPLAWRTYANVGRAAFWIEIVAWVTRHDP
jgi:hypothetical protein